jgi:hypothetical protein
MKSIKKTLPAVNNGLKKVGTAAKDVAKASIPIVEKGVSAVYGTMATGLDLGVRGAKTIASKISKRRHSKHRSVSRAVSGGRRTRRRTRHRRH